MLSKQDNACRLNAERPTAAIDDPRGESPAVNLARRSGTRTQCSTKVLTRGGKKKNGRDKGGRTRNP